MDNLLSERGKVARDWDDILYLNHFVCVSNSYDKTYNPDGFVNLGTAANNLRNEGIDSRLLNVWRCDFDSFQEDHGTTKLRQSMAGFMTEFFESHEHIDPDNLFCLTGVTSCIDLLAHCLAEPGEVFLVPTPMHDSIQRDLTMRSNAEVYPIQVISEDDEDEHPRLTMEKIITAYERALITDHTVRGIFLINPNSPLGDVYSPELLMDIMTFCSVKSLHLIVDEIFALSVFPQIEFYSILKFPKIPDPERVHIVYGLSKDFGLSGLRIGVIHTVNEQLKKCLTELSYFPAIPPPVAEIIAEFLEDLNWCKEYISFYQKNLRKNYEYCIACFRDMEVKVRDCQAGLSLWIDLRHLCDSTFPGEKKLSSYLLQCARLYITPGQDLFCAQPGWFQIVFSQNRSHLVQGLKRLKDALKNYPEFKKGKTTQ